MTGVVLFLTNIHKLGVSSTKSQLEWSVKILYHICQVCNQSFAIMDLMTIAGHTSYTVQIWNAHYVTLTKDLKL